MFTGGTNILCEEDPPIFDLPANSRDICGSRACVAVQRAFYRGADHHQQPRVLANFVRLAFLAGALGSRFHEGELTVHITRGSRGLISRIHSVVKIARQREEVSPLLCARTLGRYAVLHHIRLLVPVLHNVLHERPLASHHLRWHRAGSRSLPRPRPTVTPRVMLPVI